MKKTLLISSIVFTIVFNGCTTTNNSEKLAPPKPTKNNQIFKSQVLAKIVTDTTPNYPMPYIQKSKYIKILILPFENSENDIDYGGIIETKLEDSKFIFDGDLKQKIIIKNNSIGSI